MAVETLTTHDALPQTLNPARDARLEALLRSAWAALFFFVLTSAIFTWPLVTHIHNTLPDWGDGADSAKNLAIIAHNLRTNPLDLYSSPALYPLESDLTYGEIMTALGLLAAPVIWLTGNVPLAYNLLNFSSYVLSGFAMWLLVRHLTGSSAAGLVAGMVFAFSPWHYSQYYHLALGTQHWMVFALFFLILFLESSRADQSTLARRNLAYLGLFVLFLVLQALSAGYYAYYEAVLVGLYLIYYLAFPMGAVTRVWAMVRGRRLAGGFDWKRLAGQVAMVAASGLVAALIVLPFVLPYMQTKAQIAFYRPVDEANYWSAGPKSLLQHISRSWLYEPLNSSIIPAEIGPEGEMYPGVVVVCLAIAGAAAPLGRRLSRARYAGPGFFALLSITGLVLSFGPSLNIDLYERDLTALHLPYKWLYEHVPGWDSMRVPHRFALLFMLGLAACAGFGVARLLHNAERHSDHPLSRVRVRALVPAALTALAVALVSVEYFAPGVPATYTGTGSATPPLYRWLAGHEAGAVIPKDALLLELPLSEYEHPVTSNPIYQMYGIEHGRPMLNASINFFPRGYERYFYEMQLFPSAETMDVIEALGVRYLIVHTGDLGGEAARRQVERLAAAGERLEKVASFPDFKRRPEFQDVVYRVIPDPSRIEKLLAAIPEGATVALLNDDNKRLYTNALVALLGPKRRYFSQYSTVYDKLFGDIQPAVPHKFYDYAILYKDRGALTEGASGYAPSEAIPGAENSIVQVFKK